MNEILTTYVHQCVHTVSCPSHIDAVGRNFMVKLSGFSSVAPASQEEDLEEEEETYYCTMVAEDGLPNTSVPSAGSRASPAKKPQESEGLLRWKAPETLVYGRNTTKSDVWYVQTSVLCMQTDALHS